MKIDKSIITDKGSLLNYFRERANEYREVVDQQFGVSSYKKKARRSNALLITARNELAKAVVQSASSEEWSKLELLKAMLMLAYCNYVVMLESRHYYWPYEFMSFSRRIGEIWEPFCKIPFEYPLEELQLFVPPLFSEVKKQLRSEISEFIGNLEINQSQKEQLLRYYHKVWSLISSGEVNLELDLHFELKTTKYVVDFKSGFGSNEKGNTNRLLLVASIYQNMEQGFQPLLFVRSQENNNYFNVIKNSGLWQAYSGGETYDQIKRFSGFDLRLWMNENINWEQDFSQEFFDYLKENQLQQYLIW